MEQDEMTLSLARWDLKYELNYSVNKDYSLIKQLIEAGTPFELTKTKILADMLNSQDGYDSYLFTLIVSKAQEITWNSIDGLNLLQTAVSRKNYKALEQLLKAGAPVYANLLKDAVNANDSRLIKIIFKNAKGDLDWDKKDQDDNTPLHHAIHAAATNKHYDAMKAFLETEISFKDTYFFTRAVNSWDSQAVSVLINYGKDIDLNKKGESGRSPLLIATQRSDRELIEVLLKAGAAVNGSGILPYVTGSNGKELIQIIVENAKGKVDWNEKNEHGYPSLYYTSWDGASETRDLLIRVGADTSSPEEKAYLNHKNLINHHAVYDICPADRSNNPLEKLLSWAYSPSLSKEEIYANLNELYQHDLLKGILYTNALDKTEYTISLINRFKEHSPHSMYEWDGWLDYEHKNIVVRNQSDGIIQAIIEMWNFLPYVPLIPVDFAKKFNKGTFIHELSHKLIAQLFGRYEPYANDKQKAQYENAIEQVLTNINQHYDYNLSFFTGSFKRGDVNYAKVSFYDDRTDFAIKTFYGVYSESYRPDEEHREFIVRYPQAVAEGYYDNNPKLQMILEPLKEYWDTVIEPKMQEYNLVHGSWAD